MNVMQTLSLSLAGGKTKPRGVPLPPATAFHQTRNQKPWKNTQNWKKKRVKIKKCLDTKGYIVIKVDAHDVQGLLSFTGKVPRV